MKFTGTFEGFIPHHINPPTYQQMPCNYRLKVRVTEDTEQLLDELSEAYENACEWWKEKVTANKKKNGYFPAPFTTNEDGSVTVTVTANPAYEEFPFPVVDGNLDPLHKDVILKAGTLAMVQIKPKVISPKARQGGVRLVAQGMQILKAVTVTGSDSGEASFDVSTAFKKQKGFKQAKPAVKEPATVADEDEDF
tara:strand:+ start:617 stop:1198 length:582 start_codon:yes stop_codon:yes gene_type:complete